MVYRHFKKSRLIRSLLFRFNNYSLRRKIILSYFTFVFLLVGILAVTIYNFTSASILKQNSFSLQQGFNQADAYLTYKLSSVSSASDMVIYNVTLNAILNRDFSQYPVKEQIADSKTILHLMKNMQENDDIKRARIYIPDELTYSGNSINICSFSQAQSSLWWEKLFQKKGTQLFAGNNILADTTSPDKTCIALLRVMYRLDDYSKPAFIVRLDVPLQSIEEILNSANYTNDSMTLLLDETNRIVANSDFTNHSLPTGSEGTISALADFESDKVLPVQIGTNKYMALKSTIEHTGWNMMTLVPYPSFTLAVTSLIKTIAGVSLLVLVLAYLLSKPIAYTITKRIDRLCEYMQQTKDGLLTEVPDTIYSDEIGTLYGNYNFMISKIRTLLSENYKMGRDLKNAEYKALQSQINPHFLYNTLDMISWLSYQHKSEEITAVVYALANFYKLSLNKGNYIVPVIDEINHVTHYMKIQDLRFSGNIHFITDIAPVLLQFSIPKITLQPIVENALFHGILEKKSKQGTIRLTGIQENEQIHLCIEDDGIGIPPAHLITILNPSPADNQPEDGGSHYGLNNINKRIKLQYGEQYGLSFESTIGLGTRVHIRLPAIHVDELP